MPRRPLPRPRAATAALAGLLASVALAGCYQTPRPACAFACARDGSCPTGYACDPQDQICHLQLPGDGLEACERPFVDAAAIDAATDAAVVVDAPTDAPTDAAIDAAIDAPP